MIPGFQDSAVRAEVFAPQVCQEVWSEVWIGYGNHPKGQKYYTISSYLLCYVSPILVTWYLGVKHQWTGHAHDILDTKIQILGIPNSKKTMDMHRMIISHLICEANGKAISTLSKQNTQTDYVANKNMLYGYYWLQSVKIFYVKKLNEIKQKKQISKFFP